MVPITNSMSACRGEKLGRSAPKRAKSYVEPIVAINSIPQQDVANGNGHSEFALAKPMALSKVVAKNPAPSTPGGASAKVTLLILSLRFLIYTAHNIRTYSNDQRAGNLFRINLIPVESLFLDDVNKAQQE